MAESKVRNSAKKKQKLRRAEALADRREEKATLGPPSRNWVPWVFVPTGLLGVAWMVVYNLAGSSIGFMAVLGGWNVIIGMALIVLAFVLMTLWK